MHVFLMVLFTDLQIKWQVKIFSLDNFQDLLKYKHVPDAQTTARALIVHSGRKTLQNKFNPNNNKIYKRSKILFFINFYLQQKWVKHIPQSWKNIWTKRYEIIEHNHNFKIFLQDISFFRSNWRLMEAAR